MFSKGSTIVAVSEQISSNLAGDAVILNFHSGIYYGLNEVGAYIWDLVQQPKTFQDICDALMNEYEVKAEVCEQDLADLLQALADSKLIEIHH